MTTIPAVLAELTTIAQAALPTWQVVNGTPASVTTLGPQVVIVGDDLIEGRRDLDSMSLDTTAEAYTVPLIVSVSLAGTDQLTADTAAMDAYAVLERAIRENADGPTLGLPEVSALPLDDFSLRRKSDENGRHSDVRFSVFVQAQNT